MRALLVWLLSPDRWHEGTRETSSVQEPQVRELLQNWPGRCGLALRLGRADHREPRFSGHEDYRRGVERSGTAAYLRYLRLKENAQLSNACIPHLLKLRQLVDLQIHETSIDQDGVNQLVVMGALEDLCLDVWKDNYTFDGLLGLSIQMPRCRILAKGRGEFFQGEFRGTW